MKTFPTSSCENCKSKSITIFKDGTTEELQYLDEIKICKKYMKGENIFKEGTKPRGLYCIHNGKIKISQIGNDTKEQIVYMLLDGDVMGHRAILGDDIYSCSATAIEDSIVCFIPKYPFLKLIESSGKLTLKIAHLLANELKEAEAKITQTAQHFVTERIVGCILQLRNRYGFLADKATLNIKIKRVDLANMAGTSRETATRILYKLQDQNILNLIGKTIKINDIEFLKKVIKSK